MCLFTLAVYGAVKLQPFWIPKNTFGDDNLGPDLLIVIPAYSWRESSYFLIRASRGSE